MNLSENTVLITGGSSGIGFEIAKQFLQRDNKVIITGRNEQKLQKRHLSVRHRKGNHQKSEGHADRPGTGTAHGSRRPRCLQSVSVS